ncbi:MAG: hypothetical protein LBC63_07600 [Holophagales bacterium]|jgi:hypothetical protein|nr:hypothetical protein [Holophagales bacterium]
MNNNSTDSRNSSQGTDGVPDSAGRAFDGTSDALAPPLKRMSPDSIDDSMAFDLLENPQNWPGDPAIQATLAELLEVHLALHAHADELASTLMRPKGFRRHASGWLIAAAAAAFAVLPAAYVFTRVREAHRMQARGAELVTQYQKRVQAKLWSDFFMDSLDLLKQIESKAKYCAPDLEDRGGEIEMARRLYALGRSLPSDGLDDPKLLEAGRNIQNWLTEVSANDSCISVERTHELLLMAQSMELKHKTNMLQNKLKEIES